MCGDLLMHFRVKVATFETPKFDGHAPPLFLWQGTKKRLILGILYATMCGACGLIFAALLCFGYFT